MSEHDEQAALLERCTWELNHHPELILLYAIPNGGHRHRSVAAKLKAEGVKPGVPDLFLPVAKCNLHGLYIEMKFGKNKLTPDQAWWQKHLRGMGYGHLVRRSAESAILTLLNYLRRPEAFKEEPEDC